MSSALTMEEVLMNHKSGPIFILLLLALVTSACSGGGVMATPVPSTATLALPTDTPTLVPPTDIPTPVPPTDTPTPVPPTNTPPSPPPDMVCVPAGEFITGSE
jgi:hypothetical protein